MEKQIDIDMNALKAQLKAKRNGGKIIMVGVPMRPNNMIDSALATLLDKWANRPDAFVYKEPSRFAALGRNLIIRYALLKVPQISHIFFVDTDTIPPDNALDKLLAHDKDFVTAATPTITRGKIGWNIMTCDEKATEYELMNYDDLPDKLFEISGCGAAAMLIKRCVFEKMEWPYFKDVFEPHRWAVGQDVYFICKARDIGFKAFCDPSVKCEHKKNFGVLKVAEIMRNSFNLGMNGVSTHLPILVSIIAQTTGPILELGSGMYSTPVLHEMCVPKKRPITTCEQNPSWFKSVSKYQTEWHEMMLVNNWETCGVFDKNWNVILIDHDPAARRSIDIKQLKDKTQYMVVHDTDDIGHRYNYEPTLSKFKYRYDYKKTSPWTTVVSNFNPLDFLKGE